MIMDRLYGGVCYAGIDTDPELKYPKVRKIYRSRAQNSVMPKHQTWKQTFFDPSQEFFDPLSKILRLNSEDFLTPFQRSSDWTLRTFDQSTGVFSLHSWGIFNPIPRTFKLNPVDFLTQTPNSMGFLTQSQRTQVSRLNSEEFSSPSLASSDPTPI